MGEELERVRIGTAEREHAMDLLARQFSEGRLTPEEFSERSAAVSTAMTRADLAPIFADLPAIPDSAVQVVNDTRDWRGVAMAILPMVALACTILLPHGWLAWLAVAVAGALLYGPNR